MTEETKVELMKIAAGLTKTTIESLKHGVYAGKEIKGKAINTLEVFKTCLAETKDQFDKLGQ